MKTKDANFFQQHVEKIILGAAVVAALVIIFVYVVGTPYEARIANQQLGPQGIEKTLKSAATRLQNKLNDPHSPVPEQKVPQYTKDFLARLQQPVLPVRQYRVALGQPGLAPGDIGPEKVKRPYMLPHPPVPTDIVARTGLGVLGRVQNPQQRQALVRLIGVARPPRDFRYVSASATFNLTRWRNRLVNASRRGLPGAFWRGLVDMSAVYLERQEKDPVTGEWTNDTIIKPLPGQVAILPSYRHNYTTDQADQVISYLKKHQEQVVRPTFPPLTRQARWVPPSQQKQLNAEEQKQLKDLRTQIDRITRQINLVQKRMKQRQEVLNHRKQQQQQSQQPSQPQQQQPFNPAAAAGVPESSAGGPYGGGYPGAGPGQGYPGGQQGPGYPGGPQGPGYPGAAAQGGGGQGGANSPMGRAKQQLTRLQQRLTQKNRKRAQLLGIQTAPGDGQGGGGYGAGQGPGGEGQYPGEQGQYQGGQGQYQGGEAGGSYQGSGQLPGNLPGRSGSPYGRGQQQGQQQQAPQKFRVWAHDLSVQPGKTYRYRVLVGVLNPLFHQTRVAANQKKQNYDKLTLGPSKQALARAPWSEPVHVERKSYFFFLSGSAQSDTASVEVWRVFNGRWRTRKFQVRPGDLVGGQAKIKLMNGSQTTIPMQLDSVVVDLISPVGNTGLGASSQLLYTQPDQEQIASRSTRQDRDSSIRTRLQNEKAAQQRERQAVAQAQQVQ